MWQVLEVLHGFKQVLAGLGSWHVLEGLSGSREVLTGLGKFQSVSVGLNGSWAVFGGSQRVSVGLGGSLWVSPVLMSRARSDVILSILVS